MATRWSESNRVLVIMAKAPRLGSVKTRLASSLSPTAVTDFYRCLLHDTLGLARSLEDVEVAIMCPDTDVNELAQIAQKGDGLAAGLTSPKNINGTLLRSTATARTCQVLFSTTRSKRWPCATWWWDQRTTEATI